MPLIASIFASDILPIFILAGVGFVLARRFRAEVKTLSTVSFNALSPCLVFYQLVTAKISGAQSIRVAAFCVLLTLAIGIAARLTSLPLRLDRMTLSSFLLVAMFSNSGNYALPVVLFAFGQEALAFASVYFVTSAILIYTAGILVAASGHGSVRLAMTRLFKVPALYAVTAAVIRLRAPLAFPHLTGAPVMRSAVAAAAIVARATRPVLEPRAITTPAANAGEP